MGIFITLKDKREFFPVLVQWQLFKCLYCSKDIFSFKPDFDHLDDDTTNNHITNIGISCRPCNLDKRFNQLLKKKALQIKQKWKDNLTSGRECFHSSDIFSSSLKPEMSINKANMPLTEEYLTDYLTLHSFISRKEAINAVTMYCYRKTDSGNQKSVTRYIDSYTSIEGPFEVAKDENKRDIIVKRLNPINLLISVEWNSTFDVVGDVK